MTMSLIFLVVLLLHKTQASNTLHTNTQSSRVDGMPTFNTKIPKPVLLTTKIRELILSLLQLRKKH